MNTKENYGNKADNKDWQGNDKDPEEEKRKGEEVTKDDLTGKKIYADPSEEDGKPTEQ